MFPSIVRIGISTVAQRSLHSDPRFAAMLREMDA
jgi:hypothetical protein